MPSLIGEVNFVKFRSVRDSMATLQASKLCQNGAKLSHTAGSPGQWCQGHFRSRELPRAPTPTAFLGQYPATQDSAIMKSGRPPPPPTTPANVKHRRFIHMLLETSAVKIGVSDGVTH